jgi:amino acid adenylation domain-containing protein/thioester reductase-like protein
MTDRERRLSDLSPAKRRLLQRRLAERRQDAGATGDGPPDAAPLGSAQERFWFLHQLEPESDEYNMTGAGRFRGALDQAALSSALDAMVARQAVLRTCFPTRDGRPVQQVNPPAPVPLPREELSHLPQDERLDGALARAREFGAEPFDLATGPLFRALLLALGPEDHVLLVNQHHAVSDGWSLGLLMTELAAFHDAAVSGRPHGLPDLPVTFAEVCARQRRDLSGEGLTRRLDHWRTLLQGAPESVELPFDRPRPPLATHAGATLHRTLSPELTAALREAARRNGATLFATLLAAFGGWLRRLSGTHDLVVGTSHANRDRREVEGLMGPFVNTLALRLAGAPDDGFDALVRQARGAVRDGLVAPDLPFETLVEALAPGRDKSRTPLFNVFFDMPVPLPPVSFDGLEVETVEFERGRAMFDLSLSALDRDGELHCALEYNTDLFDDNTAERLWALFTTFTSAALAAALEDPAQALAELPLLSPEDESEALAQGHGAFLPLPTPTLVHERASACRNLAPDAPAVEQDGKVLSRRALHERADATARRLMRLGVGPAALVAVCLPRSADVLATVLAIWKAGAAYLPLDPDDPAERLASVLHDARPVAVVTLAALAPRLPKTHAECVLLDDPGDDVAPAASPDDGALTPSPAADDDLAYVIFTSGSTGRPKGVAVSHGALANHIVATEAFLALRPEDRVLLRTPLSFDASLWELVHPLVSGAQVVVAPPGLQRDPAALLGLAADAGITVLQTVPSMLNTWLAEPALARLGELRHLICAGEPLGRELVQRLDGALHAAGLSPALHNLYGPSECTVDATAYTCPRDDAGRLLLPERDTLPIGRPMANVIAHVVDGGGRPAPVGVAGELCLGGAGLARGYLGRPDLTDERFVEGLLGEPRMYRTGDLARRLADGTLEHAGRVDGQVKLSGHRVELGEVEAALLNHPDVREAAATVHSGERLVGYVVPRPGANLDVTDVRAWVAERLPRFMRPGTILNLDALPLTSSEKLDRAALPAPERARARGGEPPRPGLERELAALFEELLDVSGVGRLDDFFALGGHSLLAARLAARVRDELDRPMELLPFFEAPRVADLAAALSTSSASELPVPLPRDGGLLPVSPAQERLWFLDRLEPGSVHYGMTGALRLTGALDPQHVMAALDALVAQHESLRTTFVEQGGRPSAQVSVAAPGACELRACPDGIDPEAFVTAQLQELATTPYELSRGPLLRPRLLALGEREGDSEHVLVTGVHHIVCDAVSLQRMLAELCEHLATLREGRTLRLTPLPLQPADVFACAARRAAAGAEEEQLAWWTERLAGTPDEVELPTDRPRPSQPAHRGAALELVLPPEAAAAVPALAVNAGVTPFAVVLAICSTWLQRLTERDELVLGTTVTGRTLPGSEDLVGLFVNALPLPVSLADDPSFRSLCERCQRTLQSALAHQEAPFERIVAARAPDRHGGRPPLFNVAIDLLGAAPDGDGIDGLAIEELPFDAGTAKLDLALAFQPVGSGLTARVEFDTDLLDEATVRAWWERLLVLLTEAGRDPDRAARDLPWMTAEEETAVVASSRGAELSFDETATPWSRFVAHAQAEPGALAQLWDDGQQSRGELLARADASARALRSRGVIAETVVGVDVPRGPLLVEALLAVWRAGGAVLPLDPDDPPERRATMLADGDVELVVTARDDGTDLEPTPGGEAESLSLAALRHEQGSTDEELPPRLPHQLAWVLFTSGSTGRPKAVAIEDRSAAWHAAAMDTLLGVTAADRVLAHIPPTFDAAMLLMGLGLAAGACLVPAPASEQADPAAMVARMARHGVTMGGAVPPMLQRMLADPGVERCEAWRTVLCGGEPMPPRVPRQVAEWSQRLGRSLSLWNLYGPTEATIDATAHRCTAADGLGSSVPVGHPVPGAVALVVDGRGRALPDGLAGELAVGGPGLFRGYLGAPEATAARLLEGPGGAPLYRTGDRARRDAGGNLHLLGRLDEQVKIAGRRTEPGEIEARLVEHADVREAAVVAVAGPDGALVLVAHVAADEVDPDELLAHLRGRLPRALLPAAVQRWDELPLTQRHKLDRARLVAAGLGSVAAGEAPTEGTEQLVATAAGALLGGADLGRHDDLFARGLHSLLAVDLVRAVEQVAGVELPLRAVFDRPTVAGLAEAVERLRAGAAAADVLDGDALDLEALARLPEDVTPAHTTRTPAWPPRVVLLTGATGFLGAHLLDELVRRNLPRVLVLVRAPDADAGRERLGRVLSGYGLPPHHRDPRVCVLVGDLERPGLDLGAGLDQATPDAPLPEPLASVDLVLHCGARVDFLQPYARLSAANVDSTLALLRLACRAGGAPVHLVSTLGVLLAPPVLGRDTVDESIPLSQLVEVDGGYEQTKWVSERLLEHAGERGLCVASHRPGRVAASSRTGACHPSDASTRFLRGCLELGAYPDQSTPVDVTPVDFVAAVIVELALAGRTGTFHQVHPRPTPTDAVFLRAQARGVSLSPLPFEAWSARARAAAAADRDHPLAPILPLLGRVEDVVPDLRLPGVRGDRTRQALADAAPPCPEIDDAYLDRWLDALLERGT